MTETRDLLREAVGSYEPRQDEWGVLRRVERRRRTRRITSGTTALGLFAATALLAWSAFGPMDGRPGAGERSTYVLSGFDVDPRVDPATGDVDPARVDVTFTARWSIPQYPGDHRCVVRLATSDGGRIGSRSIVVSSLSLSASVTTVVPVRGSIAGVVTTGSCDAERLDAAVSPAIGGERFEYTGDRLSVAYEMDVPEGDRIAVQACTSAVWDGRGELLGSTRFVVRPTTGTRNAELGVADAIARADAAAATVTCEPYVRPNVFPDPEPPPDEGAVGTP